MSHSTGLRRAQRLAPDPWVTRAEIQSLISDRLQSVEEMFRENLASPVSIIDEIGGFVSEGGGKRVRPTLHLLCASACRYDGRHDVLLATVLEFIHSATLIHDDIIDEATTRRGQPSANAQWGNNLTVLFGDYLFAKAMELALRADNLKVMEKLAEVTLRMTEGEMLQTRYEGRIDLTEPEYLDLIERKTAALFACCCELAGLLAGVDDSRQAALRAYGMNLGLAFQLVDDLLDFTGDAATLGKPAASDVRKGKATLAVIDLLSDGSGEGRELVRKVMQGGDDVSSEIRRLNDLLSDSGALERVRRRAGLYAGRATENLACLDDGPARRALLALPDLLLHRER